MNFLLASDAEKSKNRSAYNCCYCNKVFHSHQALGGHMRAHMQAMRKYQIPQAPSIYPFDGMYHENSVGDANPQLTSFPYSSISCNSFASFTTLALPGGISPATPPLNPLAHEGLANIPLGLASHACSSEICQSSSAGLQSMIMNGFPAPFKDFLQITGYHHNQNYLADPTFVQKEPIAIGLTHPTQAQPSGPVAPCDRVRKHYSWEVQPRANQVRAQKKARPTSSPAGCCGENQSEKKELLRFKGIEELGSFKEVQNSFSASEITNCAKDDAYLDLSLHL